MKFFFKSTCILVALISSAGCFADELMYSDMVYKKNIETVLFYKSGKINTYPILNLHNPGESLTLSFDDMDADYKSYTYSIIHCDANWNPSDLFENEYFEGQSFDYITNYEFSTNTYVRFTNYFFTFPSQDSWFLMSGNYLLKVYADDDAENLVLTRRFYVVDQQVKIVPDIKEATYAKYKKYKQEVDFEVSYDGVDVTNPMTDLKVVVRQNQRWDNQLTGLQPMFVRGNTLVYDHEEENLFYGLTEWRYSDFRQLKYPGFGVLKVELDSIFNMYLLTEEDRSYLAYAEWSDINGSRVIAGENRELKLSEIDYVSAHFRLNTPYPKDEDVYLFGALTDWRLQDKFKMHYNEKLDSYMLNVLLKQGYYNYYYAVVNPDDGSIDCVRFQGTHFETENDYLILVYLKSRFYNTDELVGYSVVNTKNR
ncbi:DUF5103 domain-containing protein [Bacteroidota bacterium]